MERKKKEYRIQRKITDEGLVDLLTLLSRKRGAVKLAIETGLSIIGSKHFNNTQSPLFLKKLFNEEVSNKITSGMSISEILKEIESKEEDADERGERRSNKYSDI